MYRWTFTNEEEYESIAVFQNTITTWTVTSDKCMDQVSLQRPEVNDRALRTIKGKKGKITDYKKKLSLSTKQLWM